MNLCQCGCGSEVIKKFVKGHNIINLHESGTNGSHWLGGRIINTQGYVLVYNPEHRLTSTDGYVREHILIWEEYHKASKLSWCDVHHINGNKQDNRIENLDAMMRKDHNSMSHKIDMNDRKCSRCGTDKRHINSQGYTTWYYRKNSDELLCRKCYRHLYDWPKEKIRRKLRKAVTVFSNC